MSGALALKTREHRRRMLIESHAYEEAATELPKGFYFVARVLRFEGGPNEKEALAEIRARYPGKIIGGKRHSLRAWGWQVQSQPLPTQVRG